MSIFNVITVVLPVLVANVVGIVNIDWGYQLFILCVETTVLSLLIVILTFFEYNRVKTKIDKDSRYFKAEPTLLLDNVMAGIDETSMHMLQNETSSFHTTTTHTGSKTRNTLMGEISF